MVLVALHLCAWIYKNLYSKRLFDTCYNVYVVLVPLYLCELMVLHTTSGTFITLLSRSTSYGTCTTVPVIVVPLPVGGHCLSNTCANLPVTLVQMYLLYLCQCNCNICANVPVLLVPMYLLYLCQCTCNSCTNVPVILVPM
jgi:hypothetical protein